MKFGPDCWTWLGATLPGWKACLDGLGHGRASYRGKLIPAHRLALILTGISVPKGAFVCHKCNNPRCVRPDHLYVGDAQSNAKDTLTSGRTPLGEARPQAKLTDEWVLQIRDLYASGTDTKLLAEAYGVGRGVVEDVASGKTWKHIGGPRTKRGRARGASHNGVVLTEELVRQLRTEYAAGGCTYRSLAKKYNQNHNNVAGVLLRRTWKWVA